MNFLLLGGAKRVAMARKLLEAAPEGSALFSYELSADEPIAYAPAHVIVGKRWGDSDILEHLNQTVAEHAIDVMIPFVDGAIEVAARYRLAYPADNVFVPTGTPETAASMMDKCVADKVFEQLEIPRPIPFNQFNSFPVIAKPRRGSASKGIFVVNDIFEMPAIENDYLVQEYIPEHEEITVDCYRRVDTGEVLGISPRLRLETAGGEVVSTITIHDPEVVALTEQVILGADLRGAITVQWLRRPDGRLAIMEVNPRLGGGAVASVAAGVDLPAMIVGEALGRPARKMQAQADVLVKRYLETAAFHVKK